MNSDLVVGLWDNSTGSLSITYPETWRGNIINIDKPNSLGNVFFTIDSGMQDLTYWVDSGKLILDIRVNSGNGKVTFKMDSQYPAVSSYTVTGLTVGYWQTIEIDIADLSAGADFSSIYNMLVVEPDGVANIDLNNIRFQQPFAPLPRFTLFDDTLNDAVVMNKWDNHAGSVTISFEDETDRGQVITVDRSNYLGNAFITVKGGTEDLTHWMEAGKIIFDMKVNYGTAGSIDIKIDSGYPNFASTTIMPTPNVWETHEIVIADLISGTYADITAIVNMFVIEPVGGTMNVSFDNIRWTTE